MNAPDIIVGVDTHKQSHAVVAITGLGVRLAEVTVCASTRGYQDLEAWASSLGAVRALTAVSRATLRCRIISTSFVPDFGTAERRPLRSARAAPSASR